MRENDSDSEGGWQQPPEYVSPWASRDETRATAPEANAAPAAENDAQDTIAFGHQPSYGSQPVPGNQPASGNQPGQEAQPWYSSQPGYGQPGYGEQGAASSHGNDGGLGGSGWGVPGPPPPRRGHGGRFVVYVAVAALAASIGAGLTVALDNGQSTTAAPGISANDVPAPHNNAPRSGSSAATANWTAVQKKVKTGLVDITSTLKYNSETAEGTGMIVSATGLVLTNNHVIDQATNVNASLVVNAGRKYRARVVGYDSTHDVALIQLVGASGLSPVSFGNSAQISLGTQVLALGNAEGQGGAKPARGIIDNLNRSIQANDQGSNSTEYLNHMLQTNAEIQQGDSGGALVNDAGQVIGMITAANTSSSQVGSSGGTLGYAIPIDTALSIAKQIAGGKSSSTVYIGLPGFLGVEVAQSSSANPEQQAADEAQTGTGGPGPAGNRAACQNSNQQAGVPASIAPVRSGALILGVLCGTAAAARGLTAGDVITSVNGRVISTPGSLTGITAQYHQGEVVSVTWVSTTGVKHTSSLHLGAGPAR
ncbi:MAG: trypsin-like peptidase domain-containing protein [Actinomycetota bacterium]|nr:trypsin-like peptidase domain-containing protein [Actinomycetota bacterium]